MMSRSIAVIAGALASVFAGRAGGAQSSFEGVVTYEATSRWDTTRQITGVYSIKGLQTRMDFSPVVSAPGAGAHYVTAIFDQTRGDMLVLLRDLSTFVKLDLSPYLTKAQAAGDHLLDSLQLKKTGTDVVAGVPCDVYQRVQGNGDRYSVCAAHTMGAWVNMFGWVEGRAKSTIFLLFRNDFFPLKIDEVRGGRQVFGLKATKVERKTVDPAMFQLPPGFHTLFGPADSVPAMPRQR